MIPISKITILPIFKPSLVLKTLFYSSYLLLGGRFMQFLKSIKEINTYVYFLKSQPTIPNNSYYILIIITLSTGTVYYTTQFIDRNTVRFILIKFINQCYNKKY